MRDIITINDIIIYNKISKQIPHVSAVYMNLLRHLCVRSALDRHVKCYKYYIRARILYL